MALPCHDAGMEFAPTGTGLGAFSEDGLVMFDARCNVHGKCRCSTCIIVSHNPGKTAWLPVLMIWIIFDSGERASFGRGAHKKAIKWASTGLRL